MMQSSQYSWQRIRQFVFQHKPELVKAHIIALLATLVTVPLPLLLPLLVDEVLLEQPATIVATLNAWLPEDWQTAVGYIVTITLITIGLRVIGVALGVWQARQFTLIAKQVTYQIRQDLLGRVSRVSMGAYEDLGSGSVSATLVNDVNSIDTFLGTTIGKLLIAVFTLIGVTAVLLYLHWQLALFILLMNPLVIYFTLKMGRKVKTLKKEENSAVDAFQQSLGETLDALQQIRAANQDQRFFGRIQEKAQEIRTHSAAFTWKSDAASRLSFLIFLLGFDLFRGVAMVMVLLSDLSIGQMMAVFGYLWFMMGPVQELLMMQYSLSAANGALSRINSVLNLDQEVHVMDPVDPFAKVSGAPALRVQDLAFTYKGKVHPVLNNLSFEIRPGEKLALVGASGGGKTTLVHLLLGFYQPESGQIFYNDVPLDQIGQAGVRAKVATVLQQPMLFQESIRFNLALGQILSDEQIWQALAIAQMKNVIEAMPEGLDSVVGRNGIKLSGGQRQRLAIARMILQDPEVVIMDEATSALDMNTERQLYQDLQRFFVGRTVLIVAHRLSSIRQADRILVFEDGHIIESGSHEELMSQEGTYHQLYR